MHRLQLLHPYSYNIKMFNFYYMAEIMPWVYFFFMIFALIWIF